MIQFKLITSIQFQIFCASVKMAMRKDGASWVKIAQEKKINESTVMQKKKT